MITSIAQQLTTEGIPHSMEDRTLVVFVHVGAIIVRETEYGNLAVIYPGGQYIGAGTNQPADAVQHIMWLLSDEFEAIAETGDVYHLPAAKRVYAPFLAIAVMVGWMLAIFVGMM
jgi:hypothetical protein